LSDLPEIKGIRTTEDMNKKGNFDREVQDIINNQFYECLKYSARLISHEIIFKVIQPK